MKWNRIAKNPYLLFLPLLAMYCIYILAFQKSGLTGDESRYLRDAMNLLNGNFSGPLPDIGLFNGPGYPLLLAPFVAIHTPYILLKLLNAAVLYFSVILLYKTLLPLVSYKKVLLCCFFWGCYYNSFDYLTVMLPENIACFFITLVFYLLSKAFAPGKKNKAWLIMAGMAFGYLALIKVVFGYVLLCMLAGSIILWIVNRFNQYYRASIVVLLIAFVTTLPYLVYTWHITGRYFYWSSMGGNNLYWMSTHGKNEHGSWFLQPQLKNSTLFFNTAGTVQVNGEAIASINNGYVPGYHDSLIKNNEADLKEIATYSKRALEQDDAYKRIAIKNIKEHPLHFLQNCFSNAGRMLFNFPYSYSLQKPSTLFRLPLNGIIILLAFLCMVPTAVNWRKIPYSIRFMLLMSAIYLGGSLVGSAETRMFTIAVPVLIVWIAFVVHRCIKIDFKKWNTSFTEVGHK